MDPDAGTLAMIQAADVIMYEDDDGASILYGAAALEAEKLPGAPELICIRLTPELVHEVYPHADPAARPIELAVAVIAATKGDSEVPGIVVPESTAVLDRVVRKGLIPHFDALAAIWQRNSLAAAVFEPMGESIDFAYTLGWDGRTPVFRANEPVCRRMARNLAETHPADAAWLLRTTGRRVLFIVQLGNLNMNYESERGFFMEPGT
jgi:hypothetical protein